MSWRHRPCTGLLRPVTGILEHQTEVPGALTLLIAQAIHIAIGHFFFNAVLLYENSDHRNIMSWHHRPCTQLMCHVRGIPEHLRHGPGALTLLIPRVLTSQLGIAFEFPKCSLTVRDPEPSQYNELASSSVHLAPAPRYRHSGTPNGSSGCTNFTHSLGYSHRHWAFLLQCRVTL